MSVPAPLWEDHVLRFAHLLKTYTDSTAQAHWHNKIISQNERDSWRDDLLKHLGRAVQDFLINRVPNGKRLITKTPDPENLDLFFDLFPDAQMVLLIRDGRDVAESAYRTWRDSPLEYWFASWAKGARAILDFVERSGAAYAEKWRLVRYEELLTRRETLRPLLSFLGLDDKCFAWDKVDSIPVRGSSVARGGETQVHWKPVDKPADFDPVGRWRYWSQDDRDCFEKLAGREFRSLGYAYEDDW